MADINIKAGFDNSESKKGIEELIKMINRVQSETEKVSGVTKNTQFFKGDVQREAGNITKQLQQLAQNTGLITKQTLSSFDSDVTKFLNASLSNGAKVVADLSTALRVLREEYSKVQSSSAQGLKINSQIEIIKQEIAETTNALGAMKRFQAEYLGLSQSANVAATNQTQQQQQTISATERTVQVSKEQLDLDTQIANKKAQQVQVQQSINEAERQTAETIKSEVEHMRLLEEIRNQQNREIIQKANERNSRQAQPSKVDPMQPQRELADNVNKQIPQLESKVKSLRGALVANELELEKLIQKFNTLSNAKLPIPKELKAGITEASIAVENLTTQIGNMQGKIAQRNQFVNKAYGNEVMSQQELAMASQSFATVEEKTLSIRTQIMQTRNKLVEMIDAGKMNTVEFAKTANEAGKLKRQMALATATMNYMANPRKGLTTFRSALSGITGAAQVATGVFGLFVKKQEDLAKIQTTIQSLMSISMGMQTAQSLLSKKEGVMQGILYVQRMANIRAMTIERVARETATKATWGAVVAQKAFNLVAKANPYVLLALAITSVVGVLWAMTRANNAAKEAEKKRQEQAKINTAYQEKYRETLEGTLIKYKSMQREWRKLKTQSEKLKFIKTRTNDIHEFGFAIDNVAQAEKFFADNTNAVVDAFIKRAKAAAITAQLTELYRQTLDEKRKVETVEGGGYYIKVKQGQQITREQARSLNPKSYKKETIYDSDGIGEDKFIITDEELANESILIKTSYVKRDKLRAIDKKQRAKESKILEDLGIADKENENATKRVKKETGVKEYTGKDLTDNSQKEADTRFQEREKLREDEIKQLEELYKQQRELAKRLERERIAQIVDDNEREVAERTNAQNEELNQIEEHYRELTKKKIEHEKKVFDAKQTADEKIAKLNKKSFRRQSYYDSDLYKYHFSGETTPDNMLIDISLADDYNKEINAKRDTQLADNKRYYEEMLKQYADYEQKEANLRKEAEEKKQKLKLGIGKGISQSEYDRAAREIDNQLNASLSKTKLDKEKSNLNWEIVFGDIDVFSTEMLNKLKNKLSEIDRNGLEVTERKAIVEAEDKLNAILAQRANVFSGLGVAIKDYQKAEKDYQTEIKTTAQIRAELDNESDPTKRADIEDRLRKHLEKEGEALNKLITRYKGVQTALTAIETKTKQWGDVARKIGSIVGGKVGEITNAFATLGEALAGAFTAFKSLEKATEKTIEATSQGVEAIGKVGDATTQTVNKTASTLQKTMAILAIIQAAWQVISTVASIFISAEEKRYQQAIDGLTGKMNALDDTVNRLKDDMSDMWGIQGLIRYSQTLDTLNSKVKTQQQLISTKLTKYSSGVFGIGGYHSLAAKIDEGASFFYGELNHILQSGGFGGGVMSATSLANLSPEALAYLMTNGGSAWANVAGVIAQQSNKAYSGTDFLSDLQALANTAKDAEDIAEQLAEKLNGISFNGLKDEFKSLVQTIGTSLNDISNSFDTFMRESVFNRIRTKYDDELKRYYEELNKLNEDYQRGQVTDVDYRRTLSQIKDRYTELVQRAGEEYEQQLLTSGVDVKNRETSSASGALQALSEDTGNAIEGRLAASVNQLVMLNQSNSMINENLIRVGMNLTEMRDLQFQANRHLQGIEDNTAHIRITNQKLDNLYRIVDARL